LAAAFLVISFNLNPDLISKSLNEVTGLFVVVTFAVTAGVAAT